MHIFIVTWNITQQPQHKSATSTFFICFTHRELTYGNPNLNIFRLISTYSLCPGSNICKRNMPELTPAIKICLVSRSFQSMLRFAASAHINSTPLLILILYRHPPLKEVFRVFRLLLDTINPHFIQPPLLSLGELLSQLWAALEWADLVEKLHLFVFSQHLPSFILTIATAL